MAARRNAQVPDILAGSEHFSLQQAVDCALLMSGHQLPSDPIDVDGAMQGIMRLRQGRGAILLTAPEHMTGFTGPKTCWRRENRGSRCRGTQMYHSQTEQGCTEKERCAVCRGKGQMAVGL